MRRRHVLLLVLILAALLAAAALAMRGGRDHAHLTPKMGPPAAALPAPAHHLDDDLPGALSGPMAALLPMHQAVRLAVDRFDARPLDITLVAPGPDDAAAGAAIVYRLRMLTRSRDLLEIRMDALDGRFLELRGADLAKIRRVRKPGKKDH